jgi:glucose-6-phosphate dehydrogenase assembly protein OpcA
MSRLEDTNASGVAAEFVRERRRAGSPVMGMVLTLVIVMTEEDAKEALAAARAASREHPARVLAVIIGDGRGNGRIDADVEVGTHSWTGEVAQLRLSGEVTKHAESVLLPLLLPDSPVVVWWVSDAPEDPAADPVGALGQRRITDAAAVSNRKREAMRLRCESYAPGTTDLAWTRITRWRALLAAALDQRSVTVTGVSVESERISPSAELLGGWLGCRLKAPVSFTTSEGPGITKVSLETDDGPIAIVRGTGNHATLSSPGQPDRPVALSRRKLPELLAEELRHLDEDEVFASVAQHVADHSSHSSHSS